jgi:hypothetical protein
MTAISNLPEPIAAVEERSSAGALAPEDWREKTLERLEAWIDEEERLLADLERMIAARLGNVVPLPSRPAPHKDAKNDKRGGRRR